MNIMKDHVHLLIQLKPNESVSSVVQTLKGGTSKKIREEFEDELVEFLWGDSLWCDGYFAETIGQLDEATIRTYIKEQQESMP